MTSGHEKMSFIAFAIFVLEIFRQALLIRYNYLKNVQ